MKKSEFLSSLFCHERPERVAHGQSFVKSDGSNSLLGIKRGKTVKNIRKIRIFKSDSLVFCEQFARIMGESLTLLFFKERIANDRSFVKNDLSKLLMVVLL